MTQFKAHLYQTGGCDHTIGCGHIIVDLEATTFEEAEKELTELILENHQDEFALEAATLFEVKETYEVPVRQIYEEEQQRRTHQEKLFNELQEREEYERLKKKFENPQ